MRGKLAKNPLVAFGEFVPCVNARAALWLSAYEPHIAEVHCWEFVPDHRHAKAVSAGFTHHDGVALIEGGEVFWLDELFSQPGWS